MPVCLYRLISKKGEKNNYYVGQKEVLRETFLMPSGVLRVARGGSLRLPRAPRDSTTQRVCSPGAGFNPPEFWSPCGLPVSCCIATSIVRSSNSQRLVAVSMCASAWTRWVPRGLPSPRISMVLGGMKAAFVRPPPWDLGVRGASIVRCGLSCLVDLNLDLYRLCGSLHGLHTFWARGLS